MGTKNQFHVWAIITTGISLFVFNGEVVAQGKPIQIGMAESFLTEKPKAYVDIAAGEFKDVLKKSTGLEGELISKYDAFEVAEKLQNKQLDFGVFHGHEFAWVREKHPTLLPLLIAATKQRGEQAYVIVSSKSNAKTCADLRGKKIDMPSDVSEPCRVFLLRRIGVSDFKGLESFFTLVIKSPSATDALDNLARGKSEAVLVNKVGLDFYKEVKGPVFEKNLRILKQSEPFPPAVIVHRKGAPAEPILTQFRDGLPKVPTISLGREMMKTWNIETFEPIPKDYNARLETVLKEFPPPASAK
jgi:ABC-type phosphate/phosphonate transport system substrate-binding protein